MMVTASLHDGLDPAQSNGHDAQGSRLRRVITFALADPRHYQITVLSTLVLSAVFIYAFSLPWWHAAGCLGSALVTQAICDRATGRRFDPRSPLISALSLTILLRTSSPSLSIAAGVIAVLSKFVLRWRGKHIFNPANFGLVIVALLFTGAWVSPGQWGSASLLAVLLLGIGGIVTGKAKRWDVSVAFLLCFGLLIYGYAFYLGNPMSIPAHQMQSGALLIFTFFMISDPKTTPDARLGRVIYAACVAVLGFILVTQFYQSAGVIYALILTAPFVPLFDRVFPAGRYQWPTQFPLLLSQKKGPSHVS